MRTRYLSAIVPFFVVGAACVTSGDVGPATCDPIYLVENESSYVITPTMATPKGIHVDVSGLTISSERIDTIVDEVETRLVSAFPGGQIPQDVQQMAGCTGSSFPLPIHRQCLTVKVVSDWVLDCEGNYELLPVVAPVAGCLAKDEMPTEACPCRWRVLVQDDQSIVVTPDLYMLPDALVRIVTGCSYVWVPITPLTACAEPVTDPLADSALPL